MARSDLSNIVVFLPNWVGDVVMATPVLRALREQTDARIRWVGRRIALDVLAGAPWADEQIVDASREGRRLPGAWQVAGQLRAQRADLAVLLPNSFRVAAIARLAGVRRRLGYRRDGRGWLLTDRLDPPRREDGSWQPVPAIEYYARLVESIGIELADRRMALHVVADDGREADRRLAEAGHDPARPTVMLNPGASFGPSKLWPAGRYAAVADELMRQADAQILINAAPAERNVARQVASAMAEGPMLNLAEGDNSLGLVKALLGRCDLLITNDTGARHIAAAMGCGVVTVFGSTDPRWAQIDYALERIVRVDVPCSPCQQKVCPLPAGPEHHRCMELIQPERVLAPALELLACDRGEGRG